MRRQRPHSSRKLSMIYTSRTANVLLQTLRRDHTKLRCSRRRNESTKHQCVETSSGRYHGRIHQFPTRRFRKAHRNLLSSCGGTPQQRPGNGDPLSFARPPSSDRRDQDGYATDDSCANPNSDSHEPEKYLFRLLWA